ncbi:hypothetical protein Nepgr_030436 [Nepenthes gracilis]|uniref:Uncharacterized protein n=1 Tax=Nepenthes gracilis TaxID=150966 RepID=A0AAD3TET3_NEPGR|nr:hypothetical protein Nepgr_030436 [Nepenthes gracilis]
MQLINQFHDIIVSKDFLLRNHFPPYQSYLKASSVCTVHHTTVVAATASEHPWHLIANAENWVICSRNLSRFCYETVKFLAKGIRG